MKYISNGNIFRKTYTAPTMHFKEMKVIWKNMIPGFTTFQEKGGKNIGGHDNELMYLKYGCKCQSIFMEITVCRSIHYRI